MAFVSVLKIFICLVRACFSIFFYKFMVSEIKSDITFRYIVSFRKILKRLISGKKSLSELLLFLALRK